MEAALSWLFQVGVPGTILALDYWAIDGFPEVLGIVDEENWRGRARHKLWNMRWKCPPYIGPGTYLHGQIRFWITYLTNIFRSFQELSSRSLQNWTLRFGLPRRLCSSWEWIKYCKMFEGAPEWILILRKCASGVPLGRKSHILGITPPSFMGPYTYLMGM